MVSLTVNDALQRQIRRGWELGIVLMSQAMSAASNWILIYLCGSQGSTSAAAAAAAGYAIYSFLLPVVRSGVSEAGLQATRALDFNTSKGWFRDNSKTASNKAALAVAAVAAGVALLDQQTSANLAIAALIAVGGGALAFVQDPLRSFFASNGHPLPILADGSWLLVAAVFGGTSGTIHGAIGWWLIGGLGSFAVLRLGSAWRAGSDGAPPVRYSGYFAGEAVVDRMASIACVLIVARWLNAGQFAELEFTRQSIGVLVMPVSALSAVAIARTSKAWFRFLRLTSAVALPLGIVVLWLVPSVRNIMAAGRGTNSWEVFFGVAAFPLATALTAPLKVRARLELQPRVSLLVRLAVSAAQITTVGIFVSSIPPSTDSGALAYAFVGLLALGGWSVLTRRLLPNRVSGVAGGLSV